MLLGRPREASDVLASALAGGDVGYGDRASAYRQLDWLCASAEVGDDDRDLLLRRLRRMPPVVSFTGHMFRDGGVAEPALAARIGAELDALGSTIGYGSLACGADILIAEAILDRGGELHAVLPFVIDDFIAASVRSGGEAWVERFNTCLNRAASVTFATRMDYVQHDGQFAYSAQLGMGLAHLRAGQLAAEVVQLAVWDGQPARGGSGAAVDVAAWRALGLESRVIDPGPVDRQIVRPEPAGPAPVSKRVVRALIFTDYKGYSRLSEASVPVFNREIMGRVARGFEPAQPGHLQPQHLGRRTARGRHRPGRKRLTSCWKSSRP